MLLQLCTWEEVERYLERSTGIIVPIGSTEQHGPNGLVGTDAICPEGIARRVGEEAEAMVAPTLSIGMAQHHLGFPGSITLRPTTLIAVVRDVVHSLARHGFDHLYFLNGHGGNISTVHAAFAEVHAERSFGTAAERRAALRCKLASWWQSPSVRALATELFGDAEGVHATPTEVSVTYFLHPEAVKRPSMAPRVAPSGEILDAEDFRRRFPDGRIGSDPSLASPEAGRRLFAAAVKDTLESYRAFLG